MGKLSCRLIGPADAGFLIPVTVCAVCELWGFKAAFLTGVESCGNSFQISSALSSSFPFLCVSANKDSSSLESIIRLVGHRGIISAI